VNHGRIAITYLEWAGLYDQKIILPWRLIDGTESAEAATNEIKRTPIGAPPRTSIFCFAICQAAVRPERLWRPVRRHRCFW